MHCLVITVNLVSIDGFSENIWWILTFCIFKIWWNYL